MGSEVLKDPEYLHPRLALTLRRLRGTLAHCPPRGSGVLCPTACPSDQLGSGATVGCVQPWGPHPLEAMSGEW